MRKLAVCTILLVAMTGALISIAAADDRLDCYGRKAAVDARIAACSRLIASGTVKGQNLANTFGWRGMAWGDKGQFDRAIADYDQALTLMPTNVTLHNERGFAWLSKGDNERALADFEASIGLDPTKPNPYLGHGTAEVNLRHFELAIKDFDEVIRLDPKSADAYNNRGYAYLRAGQPDRAIADLDKAIELDPRAAPPHGVRGLAYDSKGDFDRAIADYDQALSLDPRRTELYQNRGAAWREKGDFDRALADYESAIKLDPNVPNSYLGRSYIWRARHELDRALSDLDNAIRLDPHYTDAFAQRGLAFESKGDIARAVSDYTTALKMPQKYLYSARSQDMARTRLALLKGDATPAPAPASPQQSLRRIALIVGNGRYRNVTALPNPPNDARAVASHLRDIGFDVTEGIDLDAAGMKRMVEQFLRNAAGANVALLFYAGHGMQIDGRNYLVPVDAKVGSAAELVASMIDIDTILAGLDDQIRTNILILDACRDNPLAQQVAAQAGISRSVNVTVGLAAPSELGTGATRGAGTLIAFATAPGQVALDGTGANSPFSAALVQHVATPGLEVQQMLTRVRADVVAQTRSKQVPWSNSSLLGEVYLAGAK
jgi:tetratricopeptide (TPR) repeat protein